MKYFSKKEGILSSYVNHVAQDSTGFIWIATREGLYKYDGYDFTGYFSIPGDSSSLSDNNVNFLYCDSRGTLWIATKKGLCSYNEDLDNFVRTPDFKPVADWTDLNINQVEEDKDGNMLFSNGKYLLKYNQKKKIFSPILNLEAGQINHFLTDTSGEIWIGCSDNLGLLKYNRNTGKKDWIIQPGTGNNNLSNGTISMLALENGNLWITTLGGGINRLDIQSGKLTRYHVNNSDESMATDVWTDRLKNVWTIDYTGLKIFDRQSESFIGYYPNQEDPFSIKSAVRGIFQDKQGNYWIYHEPGGIGISMKLKGFNHFNDNPQSFWHTSSPNIISIQEDTKGSLWLGNASGGIDVFEWQSGKTLRFRHDDRDKFSLGRGAILCIFRDRQGLMWVGSYFGGLQYFNETTGKFISYLNNPDDPHSIAGNDIRSIAEDSEGNLWLAVHGKGVDKFERNRNQFIHYNNAKNKLSNDWSFQVLINQNGDLWVATAWGLNRLKKDETIFTSYFNQPGDTTSLTNNRVVVIYEDTQQVLWAGTASGLNRFNKGNNNFTRYSEIFDNNSISGILSDRDNYIWISHLFGLSRLDVEHHKVLNFSSADGLASDEYNPCSFYKNQSNDLFFGGINGIDLFNPQKLYFNPQPPVVIIDKIKILNKELTLANGDHKLQKQISRTEKLTLPYTDNMITLSFKALNFINPQTNKYAYKLEGFEKKWNYNETLKEATYTNLNPGNYVFKVIASNNDGVWATKGAELKIRIMPPWYKTLTFRIIALLSTIGLILGYIALRTSELEKQKVLLETTVREKTSELSEKNILLHKQAEHLNEVNQLLVDRQNKLELQSEELIVQSESLAGANKELHKLNSTKDKLFSIIAHDLTNPFNTIIGFSDLLEERFKTLSENEKRSYIRTIQSSSKKVFTLLQNLLLWARSQTNRIIYNPGEIKIKDVIKEILELNKENLKNKDIHVKTDCPEEVKVWADLEMVKTILRNLISNAIKFTPVNGSINLIVVPENETISISIIDSGEGLKQEKIDELLYADIIEPEKGTKGEAGSGLGISLCRDFIKMNKGHLHIKSEDGKGACFTFSLPRVSGFGT